uniref:DNA-directed RNA polymerase n=1 Tax=Caulerpa racemosa TaxID=76317 RepID=A0A1I9LK69_CAURA|nr:beta subunit of RNA polymerase [Caulerpa racemosa]ANJ70730.1 beta subunit of RNA polymerase [Caulerpa racemosa]
MQRKSFYWFLNYQFGKEFSISQIDLLRGYSKVYSTLRPSWYTSSSGFRGTLHPFNKKQASPGQLFHYNFLHNNYKFLRPALNIQESIIQSKTYCCNFYIPVEFNFSNESVIQWVFLGTLPLLTRRGHFIINGTPRIVLNQIVRSPGIYFNKNSSSKSANLYYAEIVFQRGPWIRLEIDYKKKIWICFQDIPRLPLETFLKSFNKKYRDNILIQKNIISKTSSNGVSIMGDKRIKGRGGLKIGRPGGRSLPESRRSRGLRGLRPTIKILRRSLPGHLELGQIGRSRLNKKLNICVQNLSLTPIDLVAITNKLYNLTLGYESQGTQRQRGQFAVQGCFALDDIDDLKNRRLKTIGELLKNQLTLGLIRLKNFFIKKNKKFDQIIEISPPSKILKNLIKVGALNCQPINSTFKEFFHSHQLSQYLDQSNPLAEITHKRRLSCLGSGGISNETAGMEIRGIHRTHFGRICPIETPEGRNAGLVNSLTIAVSLNFQGFLETPFVEIYKQHLQNQKKIVFFCVEKQMSQNVFFNQKLWKSKNLFVPIIKSQTQKKCAVNHINFLAFNAQQFISIGATCIPFVEHNDANRALMGSNMQRQALSLLKLEQPIVNTLNSFRILSDLRDIPTTGVSGIITYISSKVSKISNPKIIYENKPISKSNIFGLEKIFFQF